MGGDVHSIGLVGCELMQQQKGKQKQGEKSPKWVSRGCFEMYVHSEKKEVDNDDYSDQRGSCGRIFGCQEVCGLK